MIRMALILAVFLSSGCASRPDAAAGVVVVGVPRDVVQNAAEGAAICLGLGFELPRDPFAGVVVVKASHDLNAKGEMHGSTIEVSATLDAWKIGKVLSHEFIHVALTRYRPNVANHHQYMEQNGICFGGCESMPTGRYTKGCE